MLEVIGTYWSFKNGDELILQSFAYLKSKQPNEFQPEGELIEWCIYKDTHYEAWRCGAKYGNISAQQYNYSVKFVRGEGTTV